MKMTLTTPNNNMNNDKTHSSGENRPPSPSSSPRGSPRPSPHPQNKRDHGHHSSKESKSEGTTPSSHDGSLGSHGSENSPLSNVNGETGRLESSSGSCKEKKERRTKKKSAWWNTFYPTYKSRSIEFRNTFKNVPEDERLIVDYSCALQRDILAQGRLYVTQNYLCFYANIFGWVTEVMVRWKDVTSMIKDKTAKVIPNAISVCTGSERYFFTTLNVRDQAYMNMFRVWQNALMGKQLSQQELWQWVHDSYGEQLYLTSDDEDYVAPGTEDDQISSRLSIESSVSEQELAKGADASPPTILTTSATNIIGTNLMTVSEPIPAEPSRAHIDDDTLGSRRRITPENSAPTDMSDTSESDGGKPKKFVLNLNPIPTRYAIIKKPLESGLFATIKEQVRAQCTSNHEGRQFINEVFPIHIDQLFTLMFTSSKFYLDFQASRKTTDLTQTTWTPNQADGGKTRVVHSTVFLAQSVGPKSAQLTETQTMLPCSKAGQLYSIDVESVQAGVPYADSFNVAAHYCLERVSDTESLLSVHAQILYKKSVWSFVRGIIERSCYTGLEQFFTSLVKALRAEEGRCGGGGGEVKRKPVRKRKIHTLPRTKPIESRLLLGATHTRRSFSQGIFSSDVATLIVFTVLILLVVLNVMLYIKLWTLEETPPLPQVDLHNLKDPPKTHDEWIKLLQDQENHHGVEIQKWQRILQTAIGLLKQTESSLSELQKAIGPTYASKIIPVMQDENEDSSDQSHNSQEL